MRTLALQQCYLLLPVLVQRLMHDQSADWAVAEFLQTAEAEMVQWRRELRERHARYLNRRPSRGDLFHSGPCFEVEKRWLDGVIRSLEHLEQYSLTRDHGSLREAQLAFDNSDKQFAQLVKLRKALPSGIQEDLQRAA